MVMVPTDFIDSQQMALVSLLILARVSQGTFMDLSLLSAHEEREVVESVEIEAEAASQADEGSLFLFLPG